MHALETNVSVNGFQAAFASRAEPAWHMLGTVFDKDKVVSTAEMLKLAHLNGWNVHLSSLGELIPDMAVTEGLNAVVRTNPWDAKQEDVLAVVGSKYKVFQNEDAFAFGDNLLDGGGQWETAGSIRGGRTVFGSLSIGEGITIGGTDAVNKYLLIHTSHDGSSGLQASVTPVRVVCQNTLNFALQKVTQSFKIRHTANMAGKVATAKEALKIANTYFDAFQVEAEALIATSVTNAKFEQLIEAVYPAPDKDGAKVALTKYSNKKDLLFDLWNVDGAVDTISGVEETAWGALNVFTELQDWYRSPRSGNAAAAVSAASGFDPVLNAEKNRIHRIVTEFVGV
jgi:phage/plasmid-like protein (TIGR03299 family)